jgi:hypothetical protein
MPQMQMARPISSACLRKICLSICVYDPRSGEHSRLKAAWLPKSEASSTKSALKPRQYTADAPMRRVAGAISSVREPKSERLLLVLPRFPADSGSRGRCRARRMGARRSGGLPPAAADRESESEP